MNGASEHEWEIQELAWQAERSGLDSTPEHGRVGRYRFIARALRTPLVIALPHDFATQVSARITASRYRSVPTGAHFDTVLLIILASILVVAAGRVFANLGHSWMQAAIRAALSSLGTKNIGWPLAFLVCVGLSWIMWQGRYLRAVHTGR
jgi:hypothetical protein